MPESRLGRELAHPLVVAAVGLLVLNDHLLKGAGLLPGWLTGKLSDIAGLFAFPVLVFVTIDAFTLRRASRPPHRRLAATIASGMTAVAFCGVKLWPRANALASVLGPIALDPSDLVALPAAALAAIWLAEPKRSACPGRALRFAAFLAAAFASLATSRPRLIRDYPAWQLESLGARRIDCAIVDAWVSKSGKEGMGVTIELERAGGGACRIAVASARFSAGPLSQQAAKLPEPIELRERTHLYVPFAFDNEALWNDEVRDGRLQLTLDVGARREVLVFNLRHVWRGIYKLREEYRPGRPDAAIAPAPEAGN